MGLLLLEGSVEVYHTVEDVLRSAGGFYPPDALPCGYDGGEGVLCGMDEGVSGLAEAFHAFEGLLGALCTFFVAAFGPRVDYGIEGGGDSGNHHLIDVGNDADKNDNEKHSELTIAITSGGMHVSKPISIPF